MYNLRFDTCRRSTPSVGPWSGVWDSAQRTVAVSYQDVVQVAPLDASPSVQAHNGGSTTAPPPTAVSGALAAAFGPVRGLACGQYGEASADIHSLLKAAAYVAASVACRIGGAAGT
eukprot:scaffold20797_cov101-Isochrysis_galbana.AAC.1